MLKLHKLGMLLQEIWVLLVCRCDQNNLLVFKIGLVSNRHSFQRKYNQSYPALSQYLGSLAYANHIPCCNKWASFMEDKLHLKRTVDRETKFRLKRCIAKCLESANPPPFKLNSDQAEQNIVWIITFDSTEQPQLNLLTMLMKKRRPFKACARECISFVYPPPPLWNDPPLVKARLSPLIYLCTLLLASIKAKLAN